jgi:2-dehydropantoate 2-reductase
MSSQADGVDRGSAPRRFAVVGAGSLGLTFAAALAAAGGSVTLLCRQGSAGPVLASGELRIEGELSCRVGASSDPAQPGVVCVLDEPASLPDVDGTLFVTKAHQLVEAASSVAAAPRLAQGESWVAGFQNGVVKDDVLADRFGPARTLGAASVLGARRLDAARAVVSGLGMTYFGELASPPGERAGAACRAFRAAGLPCETVEDTPSMLWSKFANAVGVFAVTALTGVPTSEMFNRPPLVRAYRSMLDEVDAVAWAEGISIGDFPGLTIRTYLRGTPEELVERFAGRAVGPAGPPSYSSMAQDVAAGRPTEAAQIFGDLVRRAARHGVATPRAELVNELMAGIDAGAAEHAGTPGGGRGAGGGDVVAQAERSQGATGDRTGR